MFEKRFLNIKVLCPGAPHSKIEKMQITFFNSKSIGWINAPCNGCDSMNGTMPCDKCCAAITSLFFRNPNMDITQPIRLEFSD